MAETYTEVSIGRQWRDPLWLWRLTFLCFAVAIALFLALGAAETFVLTLHLQLSSIAEQSAGTFDSAVVMLNRLLFPVVALCALSSLALLYRLMANAHADGPTTKLTGPVLAVDAYFIPLLSLFMPPLIMAELWRATFVASDRQPNGLIALWWTALMIGMFANIFAIYASPATWADPQQATKLLSLSAFSFVCRAVAAGALLCIFGTIVRQQRSRLS